MRCLSLVCLLFVLANQILFAQTDCAAPGFEHENYNSIPHGYDYSAANCQCDSCRKRRVYIVPHQNCEQPSRRTIPESGQRLAQPHFLANPGAYVAPPQNGVEVQGGQSIGLGGFALRFPEMRLELPSIEFPRISRMRHSRHMILDQGVAPYVSMQPHSMVSHGMAVGSPVAATTVESGYRSHVEPRGSSHLDEEAGERSDLSDIVSQVDAIQSELTKKQREIDAQREKLNKCLEQLNQKRAQKSQPCNCEKCQAIRRQRAADLYRAQQPQTVPRSVTESIPQPAVQPYVGAQLGTQPTSRLPDQHVRMDSSRNVPQKRSLISRILPNSSAAKNGKSIKRLFPVKPARFENTAGNVPPSP